MKTFINNAGYKCIKLQKSGKRFHYTVHRLVAETFILNLQHKLEVNHKNGNKLDNQVSNLEWVTSSENKKHALKTGLKSYNQPSRGIKLGKTSTYHNVTYDKARNKWKACIRYNGKNYGQKRFKEELDAAKHVNYIIDKFKLNRPKNNV